MTQSHILEKWTKINACTQILDIFSLLKSYNVNTFIRIKLEIKKYHHVSDNSNMFYFLKIKLLLS
jgi:hypothetical protein